ncbi:hypothetical protein GX51_05433 [Blastomyces parvus]|uniref:Uncharacterized protein n=1 Tax=Blastomyces parvus TaxID=2060905 RepID=A0A2B7WX24_9EURO|nr:hypothetical protein GX51_05433 [Blastomyces parvus]
MPVPTTRDTRTTTQRLNEHAVVSSPPDKVLSYKLATPMPDGAWALELNSSPGLLSVLIPWAISQGRRRSWERPSVALGGWLLSTPLLMQCSRTQDTGNAACGDRTGKTKLGQKHHTDPLESEVALPDAKRAPNNHTAGWSTVHYIIILITQRDKLQQLHVCTGGREGDRDQNGASLQVPRPKVTATAANQSWLIYLESLTQWSTRMRPWNRGLPLKGSISQAKTRGQGQWLASHGPSMIQSVQTYLHYSADMCMRPTS